VIELNEQQRQFVQQGQPLRVSEGNLDLVIVRADVFEKLQAQLDDEFDPREAYPFVDRVMAEDDANDAYLDSYQHYRKGMP
jgi:hypothetical protein